MKNKITLGLFTLVLAAIISSCSTSSDVASNRKIQKRKYNKGFFVGNNNVALGHKKNTEKTIEVAPQDDVVSTKEVISKENTINNNVSSTVENTMVTMPSTEIKNSSVENIENSIAVNEVVLEEETEVKVVDFKESKETAITIESKESSKDSKSSNSDIMLVVLVILAIIIPPLAVIIFEGVTTRFWIDLILAILGWGAFGLFGGALWLAGLVAIIYALLIVLEVI